MSMLSFSQSLSGRIFSLKDSLPLASVNVIVNQGKYCTITDAKGQFKIENTKDSLFVIMCSHIAHCDTTIVCRIKANQKSCKIPTVFLKKKVVNLNNVNVSAKAIPMIRRGDTIQYNAIAFKTQPNASAKELVEQMPGITNLQGKLYSEGKQIERVLIDNRIFKKGEVMSVLKAVPADIVQRVDIYDSHGDLIEFTMFADGRGQRTMNLITKYPKLKYGTGNVGAAYGTKDRYNFISQNNLFLDAHRLNVEVKANNTAFDTPDVTDFDVVPVIGEQENKNIFLNHNYKSEDTEVVFNYSFLDRNKDLNQSTEDVYARENRIFSSRQKEKKNTQGNQFRLDVNTLLNDLNYLKVRVYDFTKSKSDVSIFNQQFNILNSDTLSKSVLNNKLKNDRSRLRGDIVWQSLMSEKFYLQTKLNYSVHEQDDHKRISGVKDEEDYFHNIDWQNNETTTGLNVDLLYMLDPKQAITLTGYLEVDAEKRDKKSVGIEENKKLNFLNQKISLGYKKKKDSSFEFGVSLERSHTYQSDINKTFYNLGGKLIYFGRDIDVSFFREMRLPNLQHYYGLFDESLPYNILLSNNDLKPEVQNRFSVRLSGLWFIEALNIDYSFHNDFIGSKLNYVSEDTNINGELVKAGTTVNQFDNFSGYRNFTITSFIPVSHKFQIVASYTSTKTPSVYNGEKLNSRDQSSLLGLIVHKNTKNYSIALSNLNTYNYPELGDPFLNSKIQLKTEFKNSQSFYCRSSYTLSYDRLNSSTHIFNHLLNAEVGKRFCNNKLELSVKAFDLLNENKNRTTVNNSLYTRKNISNGYPNYYLFSLRYFFNTSHKKLKGGLKRGRHKIDIEG
jgi:hypothetical protein